MKRTIKITLLLVAGILTGCNLQQDNCNAFVVAVFAAYVAGCLAKGKTNCGN